MTKQKGKIASRMFTRFVNISFTKRVIIIVAGLTIGVASLALTNSMARQLQIKEQNEVMLWSIALEGIEGNMYDPTWQAILNNNTSIPFIMIVDDPMKSEWTVVNSNLIPEKILNHPDRLKITVQKMAMTNRPIPIVSYDGRLMYIVYGKSRLYTMLLWFPVVQILVIIVFLVFGFMTFSSTKRDEQNRVWIGLAKETAHQLGTPTSSLLGWIEYLRSQPVDQNAVDEMGKDLMRLMKVTDRFSKIGSETVLASANINEVVGESVLYFRTRIPKNVTLEYNGLAIAPVQSEINAALFEWVVENLLKNALDALQGTGKIDVNISADDNYVYVDVSDTGKGIPKANFKRIFEPGFTTKTRGWGLGLSLSKRIIETYHKGKIFVFDSEQGKGTTIRITLNRYYS